MTTDDSVQAQLIAAAIPILVGFVVGAGLWYLAIRFRKSKLKLFAVLIAGFPILAVGLNIAAHVFDWNAPPDYINSVSGPSSRETYAISEFPYFVNNPEYPHEIQLTPRAPYGKNATGPIPLHFIVRTHKGEILVEKQATLAPAAGRYWAQLRMEFQPVESGEYLMHLDIPSGVSSVLVRVRELRKR